MAPLTTVFSDNLDPDNGSLTARFSNATAFYIDAPLLNVELEIDVYLQVYLPTATGERLRNLALGKLKDGNIKLNEIDTETVVPIPSEFIDSGLEMAFYFTPSESIFLEVYVLEKQCTICTIDQKIDNLIAANNQINSVLDLVLDTLNTLVLPQVPQANTIFNSVSLVGQWDLDNSLVDSSPSGTDNNSASLIGSASFLPNDNFGQTLSLDGASYLLIPNTEDINLGNHSKRTVNVWFNADSLQPRQTIFEEGGTIRGLNIYLDQGKIYFGGWNQPENESGWEGTFIDADLSSGWHLATLTLDATLWTMATEPNTFKAYVDGELIGSGDGSQLWSHSDPTAFGAVAGATLFHDGAANAGSYLMGEIAKPKIFNRVLSASEIANLYNNFS